MRPTGPCQLIRCSIGCGLALLPTQISGRQPEEVFAATVPAPPQSQAMVAPSRLLELLTGRDAARAVSGRGRFLVSDGGTSSFTLRGSRVRSPRPEAEGPVDGSDRFAVYEAGFEGQADLSADISLSAGGVAALMNRRLGQIGIDPRRRQTLLASAGLAVTIRGEERIAVDYVYSRPASMRPPLVRMSELLGGAPLAGHGPRLSVSHNMERSSGPPLIWSLSASSMRGADYDAATLGASVGQADRRLIFRLRTSF